MPPSPPAHLVSRGPIPAQDSCCLPAGLSKTVWARLCWQSRGVSRLLWDSELTSAWTHARGRQLGRAGARRVLTCRWDACFPLLHRENPCHSFPLPLAFLKATVDSSPRRERVLKCPISREARPPSWACPSPLSACCLDFASSAPGPTHGGDVAVKGCQTPHPHAGGSADPGPLSICRRRGLGGWGWQMERGGSCWGMDPGDQWAPGAGAAAGEWE